MQCLYCKTTKLNQLQLKKQTLKYLAGIYLFKINNENTKKMCKICSNLPIKTPERRQWRRFGVFIVNFEQI